MAVDDRKVLQIIQDALNRHKAAGAGCAQICRALKALYDRRNDPAHPMASADEDPAAAEHYMLSRCWVCSGQYPAWQMKAMVLGYDVAKYVVPEKWMRHNPSRPTAPPSRGSIIWGLKGADDGERDRKTHNPTAKPGYQRPPNYTGKIPYL